MKPALETPKWEMNSPKANLNRKKNIPKQKWNTREKRKTHVWNTNVTNPNTDRRIHKNTAEEKPPWLLSPKNIHV